MYKILKYNTKKYDFLNEVEDYLRKRSNNKIKNINDISKNFSYVQLSEVESIFYDWFHTKNFSILYNNFVDEVFRPKFGNDLAYQVIPSIRIAFPNAKSVNFHNDNWYGHGKEIKNIWVPLTKVRASQSLAFLSKTDNDKLLSEFYKKEPPLTEIQNICEEKMIFAECDYGDLLFFPTKALHGTTSNISGKIRISFDFRICIDGDYGLKNKKFFKKIDNNKHVRKSSKNNLKINETLAFGYLNQHSISNNLLISQTIQLESIKSYCDKNNFNLILVETELIGFTRPINLEDLIFGQRKNLSKNIIVFSDKLLKLNDRKYRDVVKRALKENIKFHFVNEGYVLNNL